MTDNNILKAFTVDCGTIKLCLQTKCGIYNVCDTTNINDSKTNDIKWFNAIWDTGATKSAISPQVVRELDLKPTGMTRVFHANGMSDVNTYTVNIMLPNDVNFPSLPVTEAILSGADVLIGMDIICRGDFSITSSLGKTKFSFQYPSTHNTDYVEELKQKAHTPIVKEKEPNRNDLCPCGSGKKYKKCCGKQK